MYQYDSIRFGDVGYVGDGGSPGHLWCAVEGVHAVAGGAGGESVLPLLLRGGSDHLLLLLHTDGDLLVGDGLDLVPAAWEAPGDFPPAGQAQPLLRSEVVVALLGEHGMQNTPGYFGFREKEKVIQSVKLTVSSSN